MITISRALAEFLPHGSGAILAVIGKVLAVLGGLGGALLAIMGILSKFDKLPMHLVMQETTMVLTRRGNLQRHKALLYTRKSRQMLRAQVLTELLVRTQYEGVASPSLFGDDVTPLSVLGCELRQYRPLLDRRWSRRRWSSDAAERLNCRGYYAMPRYSRKMLAELNQGGPYKKHTKGLVWFVPWYHSAEVFDHRRNTQQVEPVIVEKKHEGRWYQWKFPMMLASHIGKTDADIRKAWLAAQDRDENFRMRTGDFVGDRLLKMKQSRYVKPGLSAKVTKLTYKQRSLTRLLTGIITDEIVFTTKPYRTEVDAMRGLNQATPTTAMMVAQQNGNGHEPVGV